MASQNEASIWVSSAPIAAEKHTAEPVQFGTPHCALQIFRPVLPPRSIASRASEVRSARYKASAFSARKNGRRQHRTGCPIVSYSVLDPRDTFSCVTGSATRPTAENGSYSQPIHKIVTRGEFNQIRCQAVHFSRITLDSGREPAAQFSATANPCISFSSFASEIASAIVAWEEAISPKCHSHSAS